MKIRSLLLPREYQQVEYIESSGTQCINTNYYWQSEVTRVYAKFNITAQAAYRSLWGNEEYVNGSTSTRYFGGIPHGGANSSYSYYVGAGSATGLTLPEDTNITLETFTTSDKKISIIKDGTTILNAKSYSGTVQTHSVATAVTNNTGKIFIFANHNSGTSGNTSTGTQIVAGMRLYSFKMWDNNVLVRNFIPCYRKSDNVIGLYDLVNGTFYTNAGSGTFIKGNDIKDGFKISTAIIEGTTNLGGTSMNYSNKTNGSTVSCNGWGGDAGTCTFYHSGGYNNYPYKVYHKTATGTGGIYYKTANDITIEAGKTYTMSVYIKASVNVNNASAYSFNINRGSDNYYINYGASFSITTNWKRLVRTFTATSSQAGLYGEMSIIYDDNVTDYYVYYSGFQIEEKDHATPYVNGTRENNTIVNFKPHTTLLPPEYQQTEYTANTNGAQYIEYPFVPNYNKGWKFEIGFNPTDTTTRYALTANYNVGSYQVSLELRANAKARLWCNSGSKDMDSSNSFVANQLNEASFSYYSGICTIVLNGVTTTSSATVSGICSSTSMYMFLDKAKRTSTFPKPIKIYYLRVYDGTDLVFNLIPCYRKSDSVIGMYDIVDKVFYSNSGTGSFNKGSNYVKIL